MADTDKDFGEFSIPYNDISQLPETERYRVDWLSGKWDDFLKLPYQNQIPELNRELSIINTGKKTPYEIPPLEEKSDFVEVDGIPVRRRYLEQDWQRPDFNLVDALKATTGAFVEVGGPTDEERSLFPHQWVDRPLQISNINSGRAIVNDEGEFDGYAKEVDFQADAEALPLRDKSLGCLVASCLPIFIRQKALQEASRVIEPDGLLIWQAATPRDFMTAEEFGFEVVRYHKYQPENLTTTWWNVVLQRKNDTDTNTKEFKDER